MSEMIERVARARGAADPDQGGQINDGDMGDYFWEKYRDHYIPIARAAIEAMREPTIEMRKDGAVEMVKHSNVGAAFTSMIDAALKETA